MILIENLNLKQSRVVNLLETLTMDFHNQLNTGGVFHSYMCLFVAFILLLMLANTVDPD